MMSGIAGVLLSWEENRVVLVAKLVSDLTVVVEVGPPIRD